MFSWARSLGGAPVGIPKKLYIATGTVIEQGEVVLQTPGTGVAAVAGTDLDDPVIGVAGEEHDGATAGRQVGNEINVYADPLDVFALKSRNVITATGGSTTTFVCAGLLPQTDNLWIGGYLEIITCAADSSLVGKRIKITDSTGSTGTLTFATQLAAFASGDTAYLCPGKLAIGTYTWNLNSDGTDVDWDAVATGSGITLEDVDPEKMVTYWVFRLHQFGNYPKALD